MPTKKLSQANKAKYPTFKTGSIGAGRVFNPPPKPARPHEGPVRRPNESLSIARAADRGGKRQDDSSFSKGLRGKNTGLRTHRQRARLARVEDSMLGKPVDTRQSLPQAIGERWSDTNGQNITTGTVTTVQFVTADYTTERSGYSFMYDDTDFTWTIPPGLSGVWRLTGAVRFAADVTGQRTVLVELNGTTNIWHYRKSAADQAESLPICCEYLMTEGDYFTVRVSQSSGGGLLLVDDPENNQISAMFVGVA